MFGGVKISTVASQLYAAVKLQAHNNDLATTIREALDSVYASLRARHVTKLGHSIVVYHGDADRDLLTEPKGLTIEAGVFLPALIANDGTVSVLRSPSGDAARYLHRGPYDKLPDAHMRVRKFCSKKGREITGLNWEIYGDWNTDPKRLTTEVFYQLR